MAKTRSVPSTESDSRSTQEQTPYRWSVYLAFAIAVAAPLMFSRLTYDQFDIAKMVVVRLLTLGLLVAWLIERTRNRDDDLRYTKGDFLLLAFLAAALVSTLQSVSFNTSLIGKYNRYEGLMTFFNYALLYFLGLQVFRTATDISRLSKAIVGTAYIVAAYGLIQFMRIDPLDWGNSLFFEVGKAFSTFGNPDLLGGYLALAAPMALAESASAMIAFVDARSAGKPTDLAIAKAALRSVGFLIVLGALLVTYTRGAWLAAVVGLLLFLVFFLVFLARQKDINKGLLAALTGGFGLIAFVLIAGLSALAARSGDGSLDVIARVRSIVSFSEGSIATRFEIWKAGLRMIKDSPFFGFGPDTFQLMSERYETLAYVRMTGGTSVADNAHNYLIQIGSGMGLVALVLLLGFLLYWLIFALRASGTARLSRYGLYFGVVSYLVYLLAGISVIGSSAILWLVLGALMGTSAHVAKAKSVGNLKPAAFKLILAVALIVPTLFVAGYAVANIAGDYYFAKAIGYARQGDSGAAVAALETGSALYPGNGHYYSEVGRFLQANEQLTSAAQADQNIRIFEQARSADPMEVAYVVFHGASYATRWRLSYDADDLRASNSIALQAVRLRPYSVPGHYLLGHNYLAQERYRSAVRELETVEGLAPGYQLTYLLLAEGYKGLGDSKQAAYYEKKAFDQQQSDTNK